MTILVVDNYSERLKKFADCLPVPAEATIETFYDPMLAVKYSFNNPVDVVFTDIPMKRMDGFLLLERVRQNNPMAQIFFVTDTNEYQGEAKKRGGNGYFVRPVTPAVIKNALAQTRPDYPAIRSSRPS